MVCDKVVCVTQLCVTKLFVIDGVCDQVVCVCETWCTVVCERWRVTKLCVKHGV